VVEHLPSKLKTLSLTHTTLKKKIIKGPHFTNGEVDEVHSFFITFSGLERQSLGWGEVVYQAREKKMEAREE
jgi:hypothetical protein